MLKELAALRKIVDQEPDEKHLIRLLLTIHHGNRSFFLFEWADGSLQDKWNEPKEHVRARKTLGDEWMGKQFQGIARAVRRIHGLLVQPENRQLLSFGPRNSTERIFGRHGDIKPENILWFSTHREDEDVLVLADLGLTRYHSKDTRSRVPWSHVDGCTSTYRPPEFERGGHIGRAYDIWSLGCVLLQFCIWYVEGREELKLFEEGRLAQTKMPYLYDDDNFFNIETLPSGMQVRKVKPAVEEVCNFLFSSTQCQEANFWKWTDKISALPHCTPLAKGMMDFARRRMLVVDPRDRARIDEVCQEVQKMMEPRPQPGPGESPAVHGTESPLVRPGLQDVGISHAIQEPADTDEAEILGKAPNPRESQIQLTAELASLDKADRRSDNMGENRCEEPSPNVPSLDPRDTSHEPQKGIVERPRGLIKAGRSKVNRLCGWLGCLLKGLWNWVQWKPRE